VKNFNEISIRETMAEKGVHVDDANGVGRNCFDEVGEVDLQQGG
jgi:hypothetical protein